MLPSLHGLCPTYGAPLREDENYMANRRYERDGHDGHDIDEVDSGELWLPGATSAFMPASNQAPNQDRRRTQREPRLSQGREKRAVRLLLLALPRLMDRETVWMSPQLRSLTPAVRVKIIYELEKLGARLAQM